MVAERVQALTEELVEAEQGINNQDPIVALKQQRAGLYERMDMQRKSGEFNEVEGRKREEFDESLNLDK